MKIDISASKHMNMCLHRTKLPSWKRVYFLNIKLITVNIESKKTIKSKKGIIAVAWGCDFDPQSTIVLQKQVIC